MEKITENILIATDYRGCNPGYVLTSEGAVIIDTPMLPSKAIEMREEIRQKGPIRFLINTENHIDHNFGDLFFAGLCPIVGHDDIVEDFWAPIAGLSRYAYMTEAVKKDDPRGAISMPPENDSVVRPPAITFGSRLTLRVGDHVFELLHTPGHTKGQIAVFVPKERVVFVGDTVFSECQPWFYCSDPEIWLKSLDLLKTLEVDYIIPGHGPACKKDYIARQSAFIREWITAVAVGIARGWSKEDCVEKIGFMDRLPMGIGLENMAPMVHRMNVERIFDFLQGKVERFRWSLP